MLYPVQKGLGYVSAFESKSGIEHCRYRFSLN